MWPNRRDVSSGATALNCMASLEYLQGLVFIEIFDIVKNPRDVTSPKPWRRRRTARK